MVYTECRSNLVRPHLPRSTQTNTLLLHADQCNASRSSVVVPNLHLSRLEVCTFEMIRPKFHLSKGCSWEKSLKRKLHGPTKTTRLGKSTCGSSGSAPMLRHQ